MNECFWLICVFYFVLIVCLNILVCLLYKREDLMNYNIVCGL